MDENNTVIKLENVSKRFNVYGRNIDRIKGVILGREPAEVKHALNNISLEIKEGERLMVMGVADSGRSTLVKIIAGVTSPSKGEVNTFGRTLNVMLDAKAGVDMEFSCKDNIYMKANIVGLTKEEISPHIEEILEFAGVTAFANLPMKRAPKGTASLISLAVHLKKDADILICDEVFGGGGNYITTKCEDLLSKYLDEKDKVTTVIVSSRGNCARKIATRAVVIDKGKITFDGAVGEARKMVLEINRKREKP